jgi:hypothetical protein
VLKWFKDRRERAANDRFFKAVPEILAEFGKLQALHPAAYMDETWLPANKRSMRRALKVGWMLAKTDEEKEWIKVGWTLLQFFQPGIGDTPLVLNALADQSPLSLARFGRVLEFARKAAIEDEANQCEKEEFIRLAPEEQIKNIGYS